MSVKLGLDLYGFLILAMLRLSVRCSGRLNIVSSSAMQRLSDIICKVGNCEVLGSSMIKFLAFVLLILATFGLHLCSFIVKKTPPTYLASPGQFFLWVHRHLSLQCLL